MRQKPFLKVALFIFLVTLFAGPATAQFLGGGPEPGSVYKEFTFTNSNNNWRVTDPGVDLTKFPEAAAFLPNPILNLSVDDLAGAISAEVLIDFWGGHEGTIDKQFRFNGNAWIMIPELDDPSICVSGPCPSPGNKYIQQLNHVIEVPLSDLITGINELEGTSGPNSWDWGQWGWYGTILRIYYDSSKPHATGQITSIQSDETFTDNPTITVDTSGGAVGVDVLAYYDGCDTDGDGNFADYQRNYHRSSFSDSMDIKKHVGTDTISPFAVTWNTQWVPDQVPGAVKLLARIKNSSGYWYVTSEVVNLTLERNVFSVVHYKPYNVPQVYVVRNEQIKSSNVDIPSLTNATAAIMHVATWNGNENGASFYNKVNDWTAPAYGNDHFYSYDEIEVPISALNTGENIITFQSSTIHHGIEIMWPGPGITVRYVSGCQPSDTTIDIWYGPNQHFAEVGIPQRWINILGRVTDGDGIDTLTYSLNGSAELPLTVGPDNRRLQDPGDFNIEISANDPELLLGTNEVVITATDPCGNQTTETINFELGDGPIWPLPYSVVWSAFQDLQEVAQTQTAQFVDGLWVLDSGADVGIRSVNTGYDRLVAIGDEDWDDYEVTVPITINGIDASTGPNSGRPGVGVMMRWDGHYDWNGSQPTYGWYPIGALVWYRYLTDSFGPRLRMIGGNNGTLLAEDTSGFMLSFGVRYIFKVRVETSPGQVGRYSLKVWEDGQPEPTDWNLVAQGTLSDPQNGSLLLLAHHADVTFGNISVNSLFIRDISITTGETWATISWTTTEPATSSVAYGPTQAYENGSVDDSSLVTNHSITLTDLNQGDLYHCQITSVAAGISASSGDLMFRTKLPSNIVSDNFNAASLDEGLWEIVNPVGDGSVDMTGTQVAITVPAGTNHDLWTAGNRSLRIMQPVNDTDFEFEVKLDSSLGARFQIQGVLAEESDGNYVRFDFYSDGSDTRIFAASFVNDVPTVRGNTVITAGAPVYIRMERVGDQWTQLYSDNGTNWNTGANFAFPLSVSSVGVFAGNAGPNPPAHTALIDYFLNTAAPAAQCADGIDNDGDGLIDYPQDPGCDSLTDDDETDPAPAPQCDDTIDNDGDGLIDYPQDPGCDSLTDDDETDSAPAPQCDDTIDNDGDGLIDYPQDPGCDSLTDDDETDSAPAPQCDDTIDNDGDGLIDYPQDPGCDSLTDDDETDSAPAPQCDDTIDNDGDGLIDYPQDPGCDSLTDDDETDPAPAPQCDDTIDNDGDGLIDYPQDPGCDSLTDDDETDPAPAPQCDDTIDNDGDGLIDYPQDPGCDSLTDDDETDPAPAPQCDDTIDNDGDGLIDYPQDPGCDSLTDDDETDSAPAPQCDDTIDNDGDGLIDYPQDPGCDSLTDDDETDPAPAPQCDDTIDNDGDGLIDYPQDPGCDSLTDDDETDPAPAPQCDDTIDNDGDGLIDYPQDPGCDSLTDDDETDPAGGENVLLNGDFESGTGSWKFYTNAIGSFTVASPGDGSANAAVVNTTTVGTNIQLYQYSIPLEPNTDYQLKFSAYSNTGHNFRVSVAKHGAPYTNYGLNRAIADLATGWQSYTFDFTTKNFSNPVSDARLIFWFASDAAPGDQFRIDNITLAAASPTAQCDDNIDNDGDGLIDYPQDPGCDSLTDDDETDSAPAPQCDDTIDNDGDGLIDYPQDPGCDSLTDDDETDSAPAPQCDDTIDNDGDGLIDYPQDPGCDSLTDDDETDSAPAPQCDDTIDNDGDGLIDYPQDPGCDSLTDDDETDPAPAPQCDDTIDNDGDGLIDYPQDPGCDSLTDDDETDSAPAPQCDDTIDNDGDGLIDYPQDPGCDSLTDDDETDSAPAPQCDDTIDNDGDGLIDYPQDPGCDSLTDDDETDPAPAPQCDDTIDNDGDGLIDYPQDPGCDSLTDDDETDPAGGENVLQNGDFESGTGSWKFYTNAIGSFTVASPGDGSANAAVVNTTTVGTNIQLYQYSIPLEPNTDYQLKFSAYSNTGHNFRVSVAKHGAPYTNYGLNRAIADLATGWQSYTFDFTTKNFSNPVSDARLIFWFASDAAPGDQFRIDNITLAAASPTAQCDDNIDNDGDGLIDYPQDPGCDSLTDDDETDPAPAPQCDDTIDNDGDGLIDYPQDPGCDSLTDDDETDSAPAPQCDDTIDNDGDGLIDYPQDPGCDSLTDDDETDSAPAPQCDDTIDNDGDGLIDYPQDPGCDSLTDDDETDSAPAPQCDDTIDNDGDGLIDYPQDPGCDSLTDDDETDPAPAPQCDDTIDNDGDGLIDYPQDPGCDSLTDDDETDPAPAPQCDDTIDNDGDGLIDYPQDPGCDSLTDDDETDSAPAPQCDDTIDNDGDGLIDYPQDPGCDSLTDDDETDPAGGENVLQNGNFESGTGSWKFYTNAIGSFTVASPGDGSANAAVVTTTTVGTNIQLYQYSIPLEPNTDYQLKFSAYSNTGNNLRVSVAKHGAPYTNYGLNRAIADLATGWQSYTFDFTTKNFSNPVSDARLIFWFASDAAPGDQFRIDNVTLATINP